jgi:hypothetical protein
MEAGQKILACRVFTKKSEKFAKVCNKFSATFYLDVLAEVKKQKIRQN